MYQWFGLGQVAAKAMVEITLLGKVVVAIIAAVLVVVSGDSNRLSAGQWWVIVLEAILFLGKEELVFMLWMQQY